VITLGQELYRPTIRDERTLLLEPYFKQVQFTIAAASASGVGNIPVALDRSLYLHSFTVVGAMGALDQLGFAQVAAVSQAGTLNILFAVNGNATGLQGDGQPAAAAAGGAIYFNRMSQILLPPGVVSIQFNATRLNTTNASTLTLLLNSWLVPPGGSGRA
jgi:hypothetical protein